ncbi:MAG: DUF4202 domain-containing protein [Myxococcota bacterium]
MEEAAFARAIEAFHAISAQDPVSLNDGGEQRPRELVQAERLARWVERLAPDASEALRLAAHCQHVGRYRLPRSSHPDGRSGYLRWRAELSRQHAATAESILRGVGYDIETIERVRRINLKQNLAHDAEVQTMEDALCLEFLEYEYAEFAERHDDDKLVQILRKTWRKMSERAHQLALALPFDERSQGLLARALKGPEKGSEK